MVVEACLATDNFGGEEEVWRRDTRSSHHIKATSARMHNVGSKCSKKTRIRKIWDFVKVKEWETMLVEVDGADGKRVVKLRETLIVPDMNGNIFSL